MGIDKYINWNGIWEDEVSIETSLELLESDDKINSIRVLKQFIEDDDVSLICGECYIKDDRLFFFFGETGGQNESDNQGWSRDYCIVVDEDFDIIEATYEQGQIMEENKEKGYVWLPYITKTVKTDINGETVWYANKWKNLLLKIKHFFIKPKYLKNAHLYSKKTINDKFYQTIKIDK